MSEERRFDEWPPIIPRVGQVVQLRLGDYVVESTIISRMTRDGKTFQVAVADPYNVTSNILLDITPSATGRSRIDGERDIKPFWRTVPQKKGEGREGATLFFFN